VRSGLCENGLPSVKESFTDGFNRAVEKIVQAADGAAEENRTHYVAPFPIRDARTGAIILTRTSGLRLGADYFWDRGARALVRDHLLNGS
jgi:hypothetical protein